MGFFAKFTINKLLRKIQLYCCVSFPLLHTNDVVVIAVHFIYTFHIYMTGTQYSIPFIVQCSPFSYVMLWAHDTNTDAPTYKTTLTYGRLVRLRHQDKDNNESNKQNENNSNTELNSLQT